MIKKIFSGYTKDRFTPSDKLPWYYTIEKWVKSKLRITGKEAKGIAFAVAKKIAEEGTDIFTNNSKGIEIEKLIFELNKRLTTDLAEAAKFEIGFKLDEYTRQAIREKRIRQ